MAITNVWGINTNTADETLVTQLASPPQPVIADNGGTEVAVAYVLNGQVNVDFLDEQGVPTAARPSTIVSTTVPGASITGLAISSTTLGYAVGWTETVGVGAAAVETTYVRYIGLTAAYDVPVAIPGTVDSLSLAGYGLDGVDGKTQIIDGFNAVWIDGAGHVQYQRYAVWLNDAKDPIGPVQAAGLDGIPPTIALDGGNNANRPADTDGAGLTPNAATQMSTLVSHDASVTTTHSGEAIVAWVETTLPVAVPPTAAQDQVHVQVRNITGTLNINIADVNGAVNVDAAGTINHAHVMQLAGGGFVVAWSAGNTIMARAYAVTAGAVPGVGANFTGAPVVTVKDFGAAFTGDFSIGAMNDTIGGFTVSFIVAGAIHSTTFDSLGNQLTPEVVVSSTTDNTTISSASLAGDRVILVSQSAADTAITSRIVDPRTQLDDPTTAADEGGLSITTTSRGLLITGDLLNTKVIPDVLVGTIGQDTIDGLGGADILDGGMGDDSILAGAGDDVIDGGGNVTAPNTPANLGDGDVLVLTGNQADYTVTFLGGTLYQVVDKGTNAAGRVVTGSDLVRNVESFKFADGTVAASSFNGSISNVTPSAWGLSNEDADILPNLSRQPDTDGWIVNNGVDRAGKQSAPVVSDSVGEFVSIMWETLDATTGERHIKASFMDVLGAPDLVTPLPDNVAVTDGKGDEHGAVVASGGANSGWGFAFLETVELPDTTTIDHLKTNFFSLALTGVEDWVDQSGGNQHDAAIYGSFLDRKAQLDSKGALVIGGDGKVVIDGPDVILPASMNEGYSVVYVDDIVDGVAGGYGKIQLQRYEAVLDALGQPGAPKAAGIDGLAGTDAHGNTGTGVDAVYTLAANGRNPSITALHTFETFAVWITQDTPTGPERVTGAAIDDMGNIIPVNLSNISGTDKIATGSNALVASAGAVNAAVVWVSEEVIAGQTHYFLKATMYSSPGTGLNGQGFGFVAPTAPFKVMELPSDVNLASLKITGISGEDSNDIIVQWDQPDAVGSTTSNVMAQHVAVMLDPITGVALQMTPEGNSVQINGDGTGDQSHNGVAGLLSDRFISVWQDTSTDANGDILARIHDTRQPRYVGTADPTWDPVNDPSQRIVGDLVTPRGVNQARRDVIVGTIGDDYIQGDISNSVGLVDELYGGMGNDTLEGGPGVRGAAGVPEIIDGGEGTDTSVYNGNIADYTISVIFDPINGAGFEITDNGAAGRTANDGVDNVFNVEFLQFKDIKLSLANDVFNPPAPDKLASFNGTPTLWSLTDATFAPVNVALPINPTAAIVNQQKAISVTNLQDDAAMVWGEGTSHVYGVRYDITGAPDPLWLNPNGVPGPVELTDGQFAGNTVGKTAVAMAGGLGFIAAWESTPANTATTIHLRFGSTATDGAAGGLLFDPAAGVPGYGLAGGELVVAGSQGASAPVVKGYEMVDSNNDTLEVGFHVAFVGSDGFIKLARYEIPVINPLTGAPIDPPNFGTGAETTPVLIGPDGVRASADDTIGAGADLVLNTDDDTNANLITVGTIGGSEPTLATLHDGELVVGFIDAGKQVQVHIFDANVQAGSNRAAGVTGLTTFDAGATYAMGNNVQHAQVVAQQNGSFGVFWSELDAGAAVIKASIFLAGAQGGIVTLETGLQSGVEFQVMPAGVNAVGSEAGFVVVWLDNTGHIKGQNFGMDGAKVGDQFAVDPTHTHTGLSAAGIDNGLLLLGYESASTVVGDTGDVQVSYLDTRQPGDSIIGPRLGAPRDVAVGTTGDDAMDGRNLADQMFGGLGDDVITLAGGPDIGDGGAGNDTLLAGSGQDQLLGGDGNDMLLSGPSGPIDVKVDRDLQTGLAASVAASGSPFGIGAATWTTLSTGEQGADIVSGGAGDDTVSYAKDFGSYRIDLKAGVVLKTVAAGSAGSALITETIAGTSLSKTYALDAVDGAIVDDGAGGTIFRFSNVDAAGLPILVGGIQVHDIENATGGQRDDVLLGGDNNNVLTGGGGNDFIDGRLGTDTAVFDGARSEYAISKATVAGVVVTTVTHNIAATPTAPAHTETTKLQNVEFLQFGDLRIQVSDLATVNTPLNAANDTLIIDEDHVGVIKVLANDTANDAGQTLTITQVAGQAISAGGPAVNVANGTVALGHNNQLVFTPTANFFGPTSFTYTVKENNGNTAVGTVNVTVNALPDPAIGVADVYVVTKDHTLPGNILTNDLNPDSLVDPHAGLTVTSVTSDAPGAIATAIALVGSTIVPLANGTLTINANGSFTYVPNASFSGTETFTYVASNGLASQPTTVTIDVLDVTNEVPTVFVGATPPTVAEAGDVILTIADLDVVDPDLISTDQEVFTVSNLLNGLIVVKGSGGVFVPASTFTATQLHAGDVAFRHDGSETTAASFTVTVSDGLDTSPAVNFGLTVTPVNDAPTLFGLGGTASFTEDAVAATAIASTLTISDVDSPNLTGATVTIANYAAVNAGQVAKDVLSFTAQAGITTTGFDTGTGVLTFTGAASVAAYQALLRSVTFSTASQRPDTTPRIITFQVKDDDANGTNDLVSNIETVTVNVQGVNDVATGTVTIASAADNGATNNFTLTAANTLSDADLAAAPAVTYTWLSSTTINGATSNAGSGASVTPNAPANPLYYRVQASYADPFGTNTVNSGDRVLVGSTGINTLSTAGAVGTTLVAVLGMAGADTINWVNGTSAALVVDGGAGADTLQLQAGVTSFAPVTDAQLKGVETVTANGLGTGVTINLSSQTEAFSILGGNAGDTITGGSANDVLNGQGGNDTYLAVQAGDTINDTGGNDTIVLTNANATALNAMTNNQLSGIETINATGTTGGVVINLSNAASPQTENFTVQGGTGGDTLSGGSGADTLVGGSGNDSLTGNGGTDAAQFSGSTGQYGLDLDAAGRITVADQLANRDAIDTLASIETLRFTNGNFTSGNNLRFGTNGNENLGSSGNADIMIGGGGNDVLNAGNGNDTIYGGAGNDNINGQGGNDTIVFNTALSAANNVDTLTYNSNEDTIVLDDAIFVGLSVGSLSAAAFATVVGGAAPTNGTGGAAQIIYHQVNNNSGELYYDADGSGVIAAVRFANITGLVGSMTAAEFVIF